MSIQETLKTIKENFLKDFNELNKLIEQNTQTDSGRVINALLENTSDDILYDLFYDYYTKDNISCVLELFILLNHAFNDDGSISIVKKIEKSQLEHFEDYEVYKLSFYEKGTEITYQDLDLIIKTYQESKKWLFENPDPFETAFDNHSENSKDIINKYFEISSKTQNVMKEIYLKNIEE